MVINAGAEKTAVAEGIFGRALAEILDELGFGQRPGQIERMLETKGIGDRGKQFVDGTRADSFEHLAALGGTLREIAHQAEVPFW